jgi:4-hydroxybenzoate polyprenyltransferase
MELPSREARISTDAGGSLLARLVPYQRERFPVIGVGLTVAAFTFSSAAFSRLARGAPGFIPLHIYAAGAATALVCFFVLRVLDEHKDADVDRRYRSELPVPRGLVSLGELRWVGGVAVALVVAWNALVAPALLAPLAAIAGWMALMTREFFAREWLRRHAAAYLVTHMAIMPFIDFYTTGLDWWLAGRAPPRGLVLFLAVTFLNGMVVEIGRKVRAPGDEREGVDSYTRAWGLRVAPAVWIVMLAASACVAVAALGHVSARPVLAQALGAVALLCVVCGVAFLAAPETRWARRLEVASQLWPLVTYLTLGLVPFVARGFGR